MRNKGIYKVAITILAIVATLVSVLVTVIILAPQQRTAKSQQYDFECVTAPKQAPLKECAK